MLNHFVQPATISTGQAVEGLPAIKGYLPKHQMSTLIPTFQLPDDGGRAEDEQKESLLLEDPLQEKDARQSEIFQLTVDLGFQELIRLFLIPEHEKILSIRSKLRQQRGVTELSFYIPGGKGGETLEKRRKELYEVQLQLFRTPKGLHCHIII